MISSKEIDVYIQQNILNGVKVPHGVSFPVIRKENGVYYLACFIFFFIAGHIKEGKVNRPTLYALIDLETGEIVKRIQTPIEGEFSSASYDIYYNIKNYDISEKEDTPLYYLQAFSILDEVRSNLINAHIFDEAKYREYLDMIVARIPADYKRFYYDLSI